MSYDLNFYTKSDKPVSKSSIKEYLEGLPNMRSDEKDQWIYQNDDTGVHCRFEYIEIDEDDPDLEADNFEGFEDTNFSFNLNFGRPHFFAKECFPIVEQIVEDLGLYILNYQDEAEPKKYENGYFEKQWEKSNLSSSKLLFKEAELSFLELGKSNYSWKYSLNRKNLQYQFGESTFVPNIYYIQKKNSSEVETFCIWPQHIPLVLPKVDFILIQKSIKKLFRTKKESGLIPYSDLMAQFEIHFEDQEFFKTISQKEAGKIGRSFNELKLIGSIEDYGELVAIDKIVNVRTGDQ